MIKRASAIVVAALCLFAGCYDSAHKPRFLNPIVRINTTVGSITLELDYAKAPVSVENFLDYVEASFYDSTIFHRVIPGFVIQGGQYTKDMEQKKPNDPILCESDNGLLNVRGTIGVARFSQPNSGRCQFFINLVDNPSLDRRDDANPGYAVFGHVIVNMSVVDSIGNVPTTYDLPVTPVIILSVRRIR